MSLSTIERALEIAKDGNCRTISEIASQLKAEHYVAIDSHLDGASIRKQLAELMKASKPLR